MRADPQSAVDPVSRVEAAPEPAITRSLVSSTSWTLAASVFGVGAAFLGNVITSRMLGAAGKGQFDLAMTVLLLTMTVTGGSLASGLTYHCSRTGTFPKPVGVGLIAVVAIQLLAAAGFWWMLDSLPASVAILPDISGVTGLLILAALFVTTVAYTYGRAILLGFHRAREAAMIDGGQRVVLVFGWAALWILSGLGGAGRSPLACLLVQAVVYFGCLLMIYGWIRSAGGGVSGGGFGLREVGAFTIPSYGADLVQFLNYRCDVFFVQHFWGSASVGAYQTAVALAGSVTLIASALATNLFPATAARSAGTPSIARVCRVVVAVSVVIAVLVGVAAPPLMVPVFGRDFAPGAPALVALVPGIASIAVCRVLTAFIAGHGLQRLNLYASLVGLVFTLGLDILLIPAWGIVGAAAASSISYFATAVFCVFVIARMGHRCRDFLVFTRQDAALIWQRLRPRMLSI